MDNESVENDEPVAENVERLLEQLTEPSEEEVEAKKDEVTEGRAGNGENVSPRGDGARVTDRRNDDEVMKAHHTLRAILAHTERNPDEAGRHIRELYDAGAYTDRRLRDDFSNARAAGDFYSTVVDADGGFLLPTEVRDEINSITDRVGVAREVCDVFQQIRGDIKVPGASGVQDQADFVDEGGEISASKRAFRSVRLNPQKVAQINPWSYEAQIELAPQILEDVQQAVATSFARAEDQALLTADGTSSFNGIDGILSANRTGVGQTVIGSGGNDDPADIGPDELILAQNELDPGTRNLDELYYVFHPDLRAVFLTKKDDNGQYLFDYVETEGNQPDELKGIPVLYTEVLPGVGSNADTDFGVLVNGSYVKMAIGEEMSSEELRQGQITDADTGSTINLATQDLRALKTREFFDLDINFESAMMKFTTNSAT
jgi:HK97 family phage major capsid protein